MRCVPGGFGAGGGLVGLWSRRAGVGRKSSLCAAPRLLARAPRLVVCAWSVWSAGRLERDGTAGGGSTGRSNEGRGGGRFRIDWIRGGGGPGLKPGLDTAKASLSGPDLPPTCSWRRAALRAATLAPPPEARRPERRQARYMR